MVDPFPQSLAFLIAFWLNSMLHGIYLMLFIRWISLKGKSSVYFVGVCWIGFVASNIDFGINLYLLLQGFWFWLPKGGPDVFFMDLGNWQTIFREVNYQVLVSVCDAFMVFRLWRIWNGNWYITILPIILLICETIFGLMAPACLALKQFDRLATAINVFLGFNTALQVVLTVLIGFRLLDPRQIRHLPPAQRALRVQLVRCIIESGLIVTVALVVDLALFVQGILFHWVFNISLTQLYAITTVLIVLRMNSITTAQTYSSHSTTNNTSIHVAQEYPRPPRPNVIQGKPVTVSFYDNPPDTKARDSQSGGPRDDLFDTDIEMKRYHTPISDRNPEGIAVHVIREVHD
ncbi:hypothetical protein BD779DRAFT_1672088 [Infundibulicybe gibba]|nr:hypothetical protein BD779DRAFT_1672088 [Infundibulicybe gibba]